MKILLINPPYHRLMGFRNIFLPLGISTIAAYSKKVGREIKLYNAENPSSDELNKPLISGVELLKSNFNYNTNLVDDEFIAWKELRSVIQDFKPDLVGLTVMTCKYAPAVKITNIVKEIFSLEDKDILKGINLTVNPGEVHAIMGPNGSGKSTFASVIAGKDEFEVTKGNIELDGEDIKELDPEERAHKGVFLSFQYPVKCREILQ